MILNYLPIDISNIKKQPDRFSISIYEKKLIFEVSWNTEGEFFSFNVYDSTADPIIEGRKIMYGIDMFNNIIDSRLPVDVQIIPADKSGQANQTGITFENFMSSVKPYIIEGGTL